MSVAAPARAQCSRRGCRAVPLEGDDGCFRHGRPSSRQAALDGLRAGLPLRFVDGLRLDAEMLRAILEAAPREDARPTLVDTRFSRAIFESDASLVGVTFRGDTSFYRARFRGEAH